MLRRFVYPVIDGFFQSRGMTSHAKQLVINKESEDGASWFGIRDAIQNYCEDNGLDISNIDWRIKLYEKDEFVSIIAKDLDDWERQFNDINPTFEIRKER